MVAEAKRLFKEYDIKTVLIEEIRLDSSIELEQGANKKKLQIFKKDRVLGLKVALGLHRDEVQQKTGLN